RLELFEDEYLRDWRDQIHRLTDLKNAIGFHRFFLTWSGTSLENFEDELFGDETSEFAQNYFDGARAIDIQREFFMSSFYQRMFSRPLSVYDPFQGFLPPDLNALGYKPGMYDFISAQGLNGLSTELNLFNILIFVKIPLIIERIGKSVIFKKV